MHLVEIEI